MDFFTRWLDPTWVATLSASDQSELRRRAHLALAQRQIAGGVFYFLFVIAFSVGTRFGVDHPVIAIGMAGAMGAVGAWRALVSAQITKRQAYNCAGPLLQFRIGSYLMAGFWSLFATYGLLIYGLNWTGFVLILATAGFANAVAAVMSADIRVSLTYLALTFMPSLIWGLADFDSSGPVVLSMGGLYLFFLATFCRRQNHDALSAFWDSMRLEAQAMELRRAKELAETATVAKTQFLAAMSHEIRTPLSGVLGLTNLLAETELDVKQRELTRSIQQSGDLLLTIVNDILDYSKIGAGKLKLENVPFEIRDLVGQLAEPMVKIAGRKQIVLECHVSSEVPPWLKGDPTRIKQVMNNLMSNAVKFTEKGRIQVVVYREAKLVRIAVRDTGIGIAPEAQKLLFDDFSQADQSTTRRFGGTGLGLAISKKLVEAMGGEIGMESTQGEGSLFWFRLPLQQAAPTLSRQSAVRQQAARQLRVLIAEDNPVNQRVILHLVGKKLGHQVTMTSNGEEAVDAFRKHDFDIILMDCQMPVMDGFEASHLIRSSGARGSLPIIAVTANAFAEDREKCLAAGMTDHLPKPVQTKDLERIINRWSGMLKECPAPSSTTPAQIAGPSSGQALAQASAPAFVQPRDLAALSERLNKLLDLPAQRSPESGSNGLQEAPGPKSAVTS